MEHRFVRRRVVRARPVDRDATGDEGRVADLVVTADGAREADFADLFEAALAVHANAHCPYSRYPVGAAVRTASGRVYAGCNVENAAYPNGTCAEAGAIAAMVAAGERSIVEVLTVTGGESPGTPCGGCRQRLGEFAGPDVPVHATTVDGVVSTTTMGELLPDSFGPEQLPAT